MIKKSFCCRKVCVFAKFFVTLRPKGAKALLYIDMNLNRIKLYDKGRIAGTAGGHRVG